MPASPPKIFLKFFRWFCHPELRTPIEGDLIELYEEQLQKNGKKKANLKFIIDVLLLFRPSIIRPSGGTYRLNNYGMLKNHFKIGIRNLLRQKGYVLINSISLSIGIASCIFISLYVQDEYSFDESLIDANHLYKMVELRKTSGKSELRSTVPYSFVGPLINDYPEIESATAFSGPYNNQQVYVKDEIGQDVSFLENSVLIADSNFFSVFNFKMLEGNPRTALKNPNSIVLTQSAAKRYFGETNPIGKFISAARKNSVVTGVCEDPPSNSHFKFSYLVSSTSVAWFSQSNFNLRSANCYLKLKPSTNVIALEDKFPEMVNTYIASEIEKINNVSWEDYQKSGNGFSYFLKPLTSIHLDPEIYGGMKPGGNITMLRVLIAVTLLIFIIACINFMNLSIARSMERAKEVGIRKVMGSHKSQLVIQFLTESFILSFISCVMAIGIILLTLPYFNDFSSKILSLSFDVGTIFLFLAVIIVISLLAGLYPAFILSSYKPISVLKRNFASSTDGKWVKNGLVIFQFWISIILITSTLVLQKQIDFLGEKDLGFDKEQLMVIEGVFNKDPNFTKPFLNEIKNIPTIKSVAGTLWMPGMQSNWSDRYSHVESSSIFNLNRGAFGDHMMKVMGIELLKGQFFSPLTNDSLSVILNETAVKYIGLENPIGKKLTLITHDEGIKEEVNFTIKGIIKDFNYQTLRNKIEPLVIQSNEKYFGRVGSILVKLDGEDILQSIAKMENIWKELNPGKPFNFRFVDDALNLNYQSEQKLSAVFTLFASLSICIAITGLFAISSYTINSRTKEIGIRKIVGANINNIVILLSGEFTKLILIAFLLAVPIAWYIMNDWLTGFAFRINLSLEFFIIPGVLTLLITWLIISILTFRVATSNPIESLKDE